VQAFGLASLFPGEAELGYISIKEIVELPLRSMANLDFHFTPCTVAEIKARKGY
jgi:hypothetical protein